MAADHTLIAVFLALSFLSFRLAVVMSCRRDLLYADMSAYLAGPGLFSGFGAGGRCLNRICGIVMIQILFITAVGTISPATLLYGILNLDRMACQKGCSAFADLIMRRGIAVYLPE